MSTKPTSVPSKILSQSILSSSYSFIPNNIVGWNGSDLTSSDFGTQAFGVFLNPTRTIMEIFEFDPTTIASSSVTILKRGLDFRGGQTEVPANALDWTANETTILLGTDSPQIMALFAGLDNTNAFTGANSFTLLPTSTGGDATGPTQLVTYAQALALATGTAQINRIVVAGNGGEVISAGQLLYLLVSDGEWYKCDADTAATVDNIILGIAQGAGTDGGVITNGVLLFGLDSNQTGLTNNTAYYASNTAGSISSTPGTVEVSLGISRSTTSILFYPRYNQQLTEDQQDALLGNNGTPSNTNRYMTQTGFQIGAEIYAATATGNDTYVITLSPAPAALVNGMKIRVKFDVANAGASTINVNAIGALAIVTGVSTPTATGDIVANMIGELVYNSTGTVWQLTNPASMILSVPFVAEQNIPYTVSTVALRASTAKFQTSTDGSVAFLTHNTTGGNTLTIFRLVRDSVTSQYVITHTTSLSGGISINRVALCVTTNYLYVAYEDNAVETIRRYDIATLANVTSITISGTDWGTGGAGFSDGTDLYIYTAADTFYRYTISGTTATNAETITYTGCGDLTDRSATCDGTSVYTTENTSGAIVVNKFAKAGGSTTGTVTRYIYPDTFPNTSALLLNIPKSGALGIAFAHTIESNTAVVGSAIQLTAIAQP